MNGVVVIDTNLLLLLIVGSASPSNILKHKRLHDRYTKYDFKLLGLIISQFSDIVTLLHILSETSSLVRQIDNPALARIQSAFRAFIERTVEIPILSIMGTQRDEFQSLGLTDALIMHFCRSNIDGAGPTLLTVDTRLADSASSPGYSVIDYDRDYKEPEWM